MKTEYHKIKTVFLRDPITRFKTLLIDKYSCPEFALLENIDWVWTEKVDGTNIRIELCKEKISIKGRTENSQLPTFLYEKLTSLFLIEKLKPIFDIDADNTVCLYGEGYGNKINKGSKYINEGVNFILFDCKVNDLFLKREDLEDIANKLNIKIVPIIGKGTLKEMVERTKEGFNSIWGDFVAEGIVAKPKIELQDRIGNRIITKIKYKDFKHE